MSWPNKTRGAKKATTKVVKMVVNFMIVKREKCAGQEEAIDEVKNLRPPVLSYRCIYTFIEW